MRRLCLKLKKVLFYGASFALRPYERAVLDAWRRHLQQGADALLSAQLEHLVSYQRQARGRDLCFFPLEDKLPYRLPEDALFPCRIEGCVVAFVYLAGLDKKGAEHTIRAEVCLHKGRLTCIEFNRPPKKELARGVEVTKVEILIDPMSPASGGEPLDETRRATILATIQSKLPAEYVALLGEAKRTSINHWNVHRLQEIHKIPQSDGKYYVLAEKAGMGVIGVREDDFSGQLYYLDNESNYGEPITVSFTTFLEEFDGGKVVGRF